MDPGIPGTNNEPLNVSEYEIYAKTYLSKNAFDYYASGANAMQTLAENKNAFSRLRILPRMLRDVSNMTTECFILGKKWTSPIAIAPTAMHKMAHPDGENATAKASGEFDSCMILSSLSNTSIEDVAKANGNGCRWFQLYIYRNREITLELVKRAERYGYEAIVLTVDTPILGRREADVRNRFTLPVHLSLANFESIGGQHAHGVTSDDNSGLASYVSSLFDQGLSWKDVEWLQNQTKLPIVLKGILSPYDAKLAVDAGVAALIVSNHGARQLDGVPSTIEVLPSIVQAVDGKIEVYLDGGIRTGTDVFKALALGAKAVFLGRPILWGLAQGGQAGVLRVLSLVQDELTNAMLFAGTPTIDDISKEYIVHENFFRQSHL